MKILPITLNFKNNKQLQKTEQSKSLHLSNPVDTVSFKGLIEMTKSEMNELNTSINIEVTNFMNENKDLYHSVGKIGFSAQETLKLFTQKESTLFQHKLKLIEPENNQSAKKFMPYIDRMNNYMNNIYEFSRLEEHSTLPMYDTPEMRKKIEKARAIVLQENAEVLKIKPLKDFYNDVYSDVDKELNSQSLVNENKDLSKTIKDLNERLISAQFYMFMTPYNDAAKAVLKRDEIKKVFEDKSVSWMTKLSKIQSANNLTDKVVTDILQFNKHKNDMQKFADDNKDYLKTTPDKSTIENVYKKINARCDELAKRHFSKINGFYKKEYENKNVKIDCKIIDKTLREQKEANSEIQELIIKIKEDYYKKQNDEVLKAMGYNQD